MSFTRQSPPNLCPSEDDGGSREYNRIMARLEEQQEERAYVLINGLESVSKNLWFRYQRINSVQGKDHIMEPTLCIVCYSSIDPQVLAGDSGKVPEVAAFPCLHFFHSECLIPWLKSQTTCPTCRYDVDPHSLTFYDDTGCARRPWNPPEKCLLHLVQATEEKAMSLPSQNAEVCYIPLLLPPSTPLTTIRHPI